MSWKGNYALYCDILCLLQLGFSCYNIFFLGINNNILQLSSALLFGLLDLILLFLYFAAIAMNYINYILHAAFGAVAKS
jgi:hypothetical protein